MGTRAETFNESIVPNEHGYDFDDFYDYDYYDYDYYDEHASRDIQRIDCSG